MGHFDEQIQQGASFLDKEAPGWELRIDVGKLEMHDGCRCILGQVFQNEAMEAGYSRDLFGKREAAGYTWLMDRIPIEASSNFAEEHGFSYDNYQVPESLRDMVWSAEDFTDRHPIWLILETEWIDFIKDRLDKGVAV